MTDNPVVRKGSHPRLVYRRRPEGRFHLLDIFAQQFRRDFRLDPDHQLLALLLGLDRLRRELCHIGDEGRPGRDDILWSGIEHEADLRANRDTAGLGRWEEEYHRNIDEIEEAEQPYIAAGRFGGIWG